MSRYDDKRFEEMLDRLRDGEGLSDEDARILAQRTPGNPPLILPSAPLQQPSSIDDIGSRLHLAGKGAMGSDE